MTVQDAELRGFLDALHKDAGDEATWRALADWASDRLAAKHRHKAKQKRDFKLWARAAGCKFARGLALVELHASRARTPQGRGRCLEVDFCDGWAASELRTGGPVAYGNWHGLGPLGSSSRDDSPAKLADALEAAGFEIAWEDRVDRCGRCDRLVLASPDGYRWSPGFELVEGGVVCQGCQGGRQTFAEES